MSLTDHLKLHGGSVIWEQTAERAVSDLLPRAADVVVIGAGIMGAMIAARLSGVGLDVVVLDRRSPCAGSTAASTALVMWGADTPLTALSRSVGRRGAAQRWRRLFQAVQSLDSLITSEGIACGWLPRTELYLAGDVLNQKGMMEEARARQEADLPSEFMLARGVAARFGILGRDALISRGSFEVDPVALTLGLVESARKNRAVFCFPTEVERLDPRGSDVRVHCRGHQQVVARHVVLATGYEHASGMLPDAFSLSSSFAIASRRDQAPAWSENALIWEASDPYLYARATRDGRIVVGGGDEDFVDAQRRDAMILEKAATLRAKAAKLLYHDSIQFEHAWAATFGGSPDGLPAIGRSRVSDQVWLAYGHGGNGVTFAALGAEMIEAGLRGDSHDWFSWFDPYRPFGNESPAGNEQ